MGPCKHFGGSLAGLLRHYLRCFGLILIHLQIKTKQHLAMSAIQNQKALWRKKRQCDAKDVKSKTKTASHVKIVKCKIRTNSYAENAKTKSIWGCYHRKQGETSSKGPLTDHCKRRMPYLGETSLQLEKEWQ